MRFVRLCTLAATAAALLFVSKPATAGVLPLPGNLGPNGVTGIDLIGNTTVVGDKTFGFISATPNSVSTIDPSQVTVTPLTAVLNGTVTPDGIEFSGAFLNTAPPDADLTLKYTVTSSGAPIASVDLSDNATTSGTGFAQVVEQVFEGINGAPGALLGQAVLTGPGSTNIVLSTPETSLYIQKDILYAAGPNGYATFSIIDQAFPQVPEPTSAVMTSMGLVGVLVMAWRKKRTAKA